MLNAVAPVRALPVRWLRRLAAAAGLLGAETIHVVVMAEHFTQWLPAGLFFLVVAVLEGLAAVALIVGASRRVEQLAIVLNLATVAVWVVSRTVGLPVGPMAGMAEPVGRADLIATTLELATVAVLLVKVRESETAVRSRGVLSSLLVLGAAAAVTGFGLAPDSSDRHGAPDFYPPCPSQPADGPSCSPSDPVTAKRQVIQPVRGGGLTGSNGSTTTTGSATR
jgi:hypothetical protein